MTLRELVWFAAQINLQRWRFFYARMAIKGRLREEHFRVCSPSERLTDSDISIADRILKFRDSLYAQSRLDA
jgi:hypothetical protein